MKNLLSAVPEDMNEIDHKFYEYYGFLYNHLFRGESKTGILVEEDSYSIIWKSCFYKPDEEEIEMGIDEAMTIDFLYVDKDLTFDLNGVFECVKPDSDLEHLIQDAKKNWFQKTKDYIIKEIEIINNPNSIFHISKKMKKKKIFSYAPIIEKLFPDLMYLLESEQEKE